MQTPEDQGVGRAFEMRGDFTASVAISSMGLAEKLDRRDARWKQLNGSYTNRIVTAGELAAAIRMGYSYTAWHEPNYRNSVNWIQSQFIAVDIDTEDERSSFRTLMRNPMVAGNASILHTTMSHTTDKPRCRVIFFLDKPLTSPESYSAACAFWGKYLGGDPCATDPSRNFYGAKGCEVEVIGRRLCVAHLRFLYQKNQALNARCTRKPTKSFAPEMNEEKAKRIEQALAQINPWGIDYRDWYRILAAIKNELGDAGLAIADKWANGEKGEVERIFKYTRREGGNRVGMGTIMRFVQRVH